MPSFGCRNAAGAWLGTYVRAIARDETKDFRIAGKLLFSFLDFIDLVCTYERHYGAHKL